MPLMEWVHAKVLLLLLLPSLSVCRGTAGSCKDDRSCQANVRSLMDELGTVGTDMQGKRTTLESLDRLRRSVSSGARIELPAAQRSYLERGSVLIDDVTYDVRHRPISTNRTRHVHRSKLIANSSEVILHALMPITPKTMSSKSGPFTLLITICARGRISIHSVATGDLLVDSLDLGHRDGTRIRHLVLSRDQGRHYVLTADDIGEMRLHDIKVVAKKADVKKWTARPSPPPRPETCENGSESCNATSVEEAGPTEPQEEVKAELSTRLSDRRITIATNFSTSLKLLADDSGHALRLNSVISVERDDGMYFVAGDSNGVLTVFHANGTLKGRTKVTGDAGGIRGLLRGHATQLVFFSSHSFGFFSVSQVDMPFAPCTGWNTPLVDMVLDPNYGYSKAVLALADGDVLVYSTQKDKARVCELTLKFPRVSRLPFKLQMWSYHVVGMQLPLADAAGLQSQTTAKKLPVDPVRELFFFNTLAMDAVHGVVATRIVTAQLNFLPRRLDDFAIHGIPGMTQGERSRAQLALRYVGEAGVEVAELTLKQPSPPKNLVAESDEDVHWMNRIPKIWIFAIVVLGVVAWNFREAKWRHKASENAGSSLDKDAQAAGSSGNKKEDDKGEADDDLGRD